MAKASDMLETLAQELARIRTEIERLRVEEAALVRIQAAFSGEKMEEPSAKKRLTNVKPLVLDIMQRAGFLGATAAEVVALAKVESPNVAPATVTSLLSRLKADGALLRDGDRYYDIRYAKDRVEQRVTEVASSLRVN
ncbi:hypothetical protein GON01_08195 [Sphingomonas sp. MAH-20]|uniref:Uncharacterized protein n=1 Tax=Sphingomonas horti TaxID=2682842 RepID=A0A6I4J031_9SPHN|nr:MULTISPECIES: hypothetical protein [Sphingomonas]MBA2920032.1 hypothetical protein [Sphingomonas sp. CGMCC 1.13658]MVO77912.1 hypothetical protein [Sphingomonas horti]